ncbi:MAG: metal-dependent transcriptional regulator [Spirochaetes bacterium]|nr:MAG: metal-dependent transcriptional regulator [Spirochaetota bacterium]
MKRDKRQEPEEFGSTELSPNMEDYLERIALLATRQRVVRVKDIAKSLEITMPSVSAALARLREKGLIESEKYEYIELTPQGKELADRVYRKHSFLADFFHTVLRMDRNAADSEACKLEHHLSPEACRQIFRLVEFHRDQAGSESGWTGDLRNILDEKPLSELKEGDRAVIRRVSVEGELRKRLVEMGFRKGERIRVVRYAPLRNPLELELKGYHLSLRVEEARGIMVKQVRESDEA